jgi:hypothetical protein
MYTYIYIYDIAPCSKLINITEHDACGSWAALLGIKDGAPVVKRTDIFITSKLAPRELGFHNAVQAQYTAFHATKLLGTKLNCITLT